MSSANGVLRNDHRKQNLSHLVKMLLLIFKAYGPTSGNYVRVITKYMVQQIEPTLLQQNRLLNIVRCFGEPYIISISI